MMLAHVFGSVMSVSSYFNNLILGHWSLKKSRRNYGL